MIRHVKARCSGSQRGRARLIGRVITLGLMFKMRLVVGLALAATAAAGAGVALAATSTPQVPTFSFSKHVAREPATIVLAEIAAPELAGTGSKLSHPGAISWKTWTARTATGTGAAWVDPCIPSCADDRYGRYPVTITLSRPGRLGGHLVFRRISLKFSGKKPPGGFPTRIWVVVHTGRYGFVFGT